MQKWLPICLVLTFTGGCFHSEHGAPRRAQNEIAQLSAAVENFKEHFGAYPPSRIKLSETCSYPDRDQPGTLDADSVRFLHLIWPAFDLHTGRAIDWNGDDAIKGDWTLEGDECLVFFLGGAQFRAGETNGYMGFSTDPKDPLKRGGERVGPFLTFDPSRLRDIHGRGFSSYLDVFGRQPYAYLNASGYDRHGETDCPGLGVWPYAEALQPEPRFWKPHSFQIISAGPDGKFGPGTKDPSLVWTPAGAASIPAEGRDDLSNFYGTLLGIPTPP
jgi:hypothetical protein